MNISDKRLVFVVGNSRSGTTMMMRIMSKHPEIHSVNEIHFFEKLWSAADKIRVITREEAIQVASQLLHVRYKGYLAAVDHSTFADEAVEVVDRIPNDTLYRHDVFLAFMQRETEKAGKRIPCEKTPQNVFYVKEILELFPNARVINMIRDPRGVLLSQKKKWLRKNNKDAYLSKHRKEVWRLRINYHPITISQLWNSSIQAIRKFDEDERVMNVRFEDITGQPEIELKRVCEFLEVPFSEEMHKVEYIGSSLEKDQPGGLGIKKNRTDSWRKKGGLTRAEIWFCQRISGHLFTQYGYEKISTKPNWLLILGYYVSFPLKLGLALMMNLHRMKNVMDSVKRRLFA